MDTKLFELLKAYLSSGSMSPNSIDFQRRLVAIINVYKKEEGGGANNSSAIEDIPF